MLHDVSDVAYDKGVELMSDAGRQGTHKEDNRQI